jgi:hypothetical protein
MSSLQRRLLILSDNLAVIDETGTNLKAQLFELDRLRKQVGAARSSTEETRGLYADRAAMQPLR